MMPSCLTCSMAACADRYTAPSRLTEPGHRRTRSRPDSTGLGCWLAA
jgi:hypothetical protein